MVLALFVSTSFNVKSVSASGSRTHDVPSLHDIIRTTASTDKLPKIESHTILLSKNSIDGDTLEMPDSDIPHNGEQLYGEIIGSPEQRVRQEARELRREQKKKRSRSSGRRNKRNRYRRRHKRRRSFVSARLGLKQKSCPVRTEYVSKKTAEDIFGDIVDVYPVIHIANLALEQYFYESFCDVERCACAGVDNNKFKSSCQSTHSFTYAKVVKSGEIGWSYIQVRSGCSCVIQVKEQSVHSILRTN